MVKVATAGHIGRDAPTRIQEESGKTIATFSLAVRRRDDTTEWVQCSLQGNRAEALAPHLKKGVGVFISGDVFADGWIDKDTKEVRTTLKVFVTDLTFVTGAKGREGKGKGVEQATPELEDAATV